MNCYLPVRNRNEVILWLGFDLIDMIVGFDHAERRMQNLIENINGFLVGDGPDSLKASGQFHL